MFGGEGFLAAAERKGRRRLEGYEVRAGYVGRRFVLWKRFPAEDLAAKLLLQVRRPVVAHDAAAIFGSQAVMVQQ